MVIVNDKIIGLSVKRVLFPDKTIPAQGCHFIRYTRFDNSIEELKEKCVEEVSYTLVSDLNKSPEEILAKFSTTFRYDTRRSQKENVENKCFFPENFMKEDLSSILKDFKKVYDHFCDLTGQKYVKRAFNRKLLNKYIKSGCFMLSQAVFEGGKIYHAYIFDENTAVLWYSASDFRNKGVDKSLAGRANKGLHYFDMITFKERGLKVYDWGNVSTKNNENPNGIDVFKTGFNGDYCEKFCYTLPITKLAKLILKIKGR